MMKVKVHVDTECYKNKPKDFYNIKPRLQNNNAIQEIELEELINKIKLGYSISPGVMVNGMSSNNWTEQSLFMIDIDNNETEIPILELHRAIEICKNNNVLPIFSYYTFSHTKQIPKYRLAFLLDKPINDMVIREKIVSTLIDLFPQSDKACKNADRIFLGTNKQVNIYNLNNRIKTDDILRIAPKPNANLNSNNTLSCNLTNAQKTFDLLGYMCRDNQISHTTNDITYFKTCSICGHKDCLRYYPKTNTFYCYGANGSVGGSIIDYLMANEKLTIQQAMSKFEELNQTNKKSISNEVEWFTAEQLQKMELPQVIFYVSNIIPQGLTLVCSAPKLGKSWFALQLCLSITRGESFLGFNTKQCACMYLALEDSKNRLQERINKLLKGSDFPSNLYLTTSVADINNGLVGLLEEKINQNKDIKVIVIDTLQKVRGVSKNTNVYANDYKELSTLKALADKYNLSIILIHHLRKAIKGTDSEDVFESVLGTTGVTGTADTTLVLKKKDRQAEETKLYITGRDVEINTYVVRLDKETCMWQMISNVEDYHKHVQHQLYDNSTLVATIKTLLKDNKSWSGTLKELNEEHRKIYKRYYAETSQKLKREIESIESLLYECDNIIYIPAGKHPTIKGRVLTLRIE